MSELLGPAPERAVVAYLYHDASTPEDAHPWLHSTMLVLAADRRPTLRNETPLVTLAQAEAMVAAERERCARLCERPVETLQLPDAKQYEGDVRHVERRVALAVAAAIRRA